MQRFMQYAVAFLEGIITFISPCLLPMLPIYISYFAGSGERSTKKTFLGALGFVSGFTVIFVAMDTLAGTIGSFLREYKGAVNLISGLIVILFGLNFLGIFKMNLFRGGSKTLNSREMGFFPAMLFGIIFSFRHLGLNINEKMELLLFRSLPETTLRLVQTFPGDNGTEFFFTISLAKGTQTNISLLFLSTKRKLFSILKLESLIGKSLNKIFKALRFLFEYRVDSFTKLVTLSSLFRENRSFLTLSIRLRCDDGKPVFCAYTITQPLNRQTGKEEVVELPGTANRCRIINDVIVYRGWDAGNSNLLL